jgi:hypothetical protein
VLLLLGEEGLTKLRMSLEHRTELLNWISKLLI